MCEWPTRSRLPTGQSKDLLSNVPGAAGGEKRHRAGFLLAGARGPGCRPGRPQAAGSSWVPVANGLSQTGKNSAEGEEACSQEAGRASWRKGHEPGLVFVPQP